MLCRVPSVRAVVGVLRVVDAAGDASQSSRQRLLELYRPILGEDTCVRTAWLPDLKTLVTVVTDVPSPAIGAGDRIVWGLPVGYDGVSSDAAIEDVLEDPRRARDLVGVYVLIALDGSRVRCVTSAAMPETLKIVEGPVGTAVVTRSLSGIVLSGLQPRISHAAVVDFVLFDFPIASDEVLAGTTVLDEASVVDVDADGIRAWSYWTAEERLRPSSPTTPESLVSVLTDVTGRLGSVSGAHLALTSGRDSTLLAACLDQLGTPVPAFTMGPSESRDVIGAARTADVLGLSYQSVPIGTRQPSDRFAEIVRWAPWHEGLRRGWDYSASWLDWDMRGLRYVGGQGGEIGRSFYGPPTSSVEEAATVLRRRGTHLAQPAREVLHTRITTSLDVLHRFGRRDEDLLDLFYAKHRARRFFVRFQPMPQFDAYFTPYLEPSVVSALLGVPVDRRDGTLFDEAMTSLRPELTSRPRASPPLSAPRAGRRGLVATLTGRLGRHAHEGRGFTAIEETMARCGGLPLVGGVMGEAWVSRTIAAGRRGSGHAFRTLWNALAVESLRAYLETDEPQEPRPSDAAVLD